MQFPEGLENTPFTFKLNIRYLCNSQAQLVETCTKAPDTYVHKNVLSEKIKAYCVN